MGTPKDLTAKMLKMLDPDADAGFLVASYRKKDGSGASVGMSLVEHVDSEQLMNLLAMANHALNDSMVDMMHQLAKDTNLSLEEVHMIVMRRAVKLKKAQDQGLGSTKKYQEGSSESRWPLAGRAAKAEVS